MTLAALKKKKKEEERKKSVNTQSAQLSEPNGQLPKAGRPETLVLIPQPTGRERERKKDGVSSVDLIARALLSEAAFPASSRMLGRSSLPALPISTI